MRTTQKLLHTMGRKGYSRMAHDLKRKNPNIKGLRTRVWTHGHLRKDGKPINEAVAETLRKIEDCAESISDTPAKNSIRDDAVARILGPERRGRVRGLGLGVTPSKVDGNVQSSEKVRELESKLQTQSVRMEAFEEKVEALLKLSQNENKNVDDMSSRAFTPQNVAKKRIRQRAKNVAETLGSTATLKPTTDTRTLQ
ncbi:uncharacterized protein LOC111378150 [Olea europaea var. sylvestris]|uniref:uncharacterized protein LOC111378150 n=1 Tax=Olea europaea var. sylvestris TaxID=158386 RepID=UPI000C1D8400|nr:uncharacterized protein LOC111378150 [Olea europaea var. sylvestris]